MSLRASLLLHSPPAFACGPRREWRRRGRSRGGEEMFSGSPCPVCGHVVEVTQLNAHVNACLDAMEDTQAEEQQADDLEDDAEWEVLDVPAADGSVQRASKRRAIMNHLSSMVHGKQEAVSHASRPIAAADFELLDATAPEATFPASKLLRLEDYQCTKSQVDHNLDGRKAAQWADMPATFPTDRSLAAAKLKFVIRHGVPDSRRRQIWRLITGVDEYLEAHPGRYAIELEQVFGQVLPSSHFVTPTFGGELRPDVTFLQPDGIFVTQRLLCLLASTMSVVEYSPALPDLLGMLLLFLEEEEAYVAAKLMLQASLSRRTFLPTTMKDLVAHVDTVDRLIGEVMPEVYTRMKSLDLSARDFVLEWFSRLFVSILPLHTVLRVMDAFFCEGVEVLYRVALAVMQESAAILARSPTKDVFLTILQQRAMKLTNQEALVAAAFRMHIKARKVSNYQLQSVRAVNADSDLEQPAPQVYYRPRMLSQSFIVSEAQLEMVHSWMPAKYRTKDLVLLFSTETDGFSLTCMILNTMRHSPTLLVIKDKENAVFGAFVTAPWKRSGGKPFGDSDMFVFALLPTPQPFYWQEKSNSHFVKVDHRSLKIGDGGDGAAIQLDDELLHGFSAGSATYANESLCGGPKETFKAMEIEVWGFA